jgi:competence protein ComEC
MASNPNFNSKMSLDSTASRVAKLWILIEIVLTVISLILLFPLPETTAALLLVILLAIILTLVIGAFLYLRYSFLPAVKEKRSIVNEKTKLQNKISNNKSKLDEIDRALNSNQASEQKEIETALQKIHEEYIANGLRAEKIEGGNVPGVGPKLKEKLKANRINNAADVGTHIQAIDGFGEAKVQALLNWKQTILQRLESTKPGKLTDQQLNEIHQKYSRQRDNLTKTRESYQVKHTELDLELKSVTRNLQNFVGVDFGNYLSMNLLGRFNNDQVQKNRKVLLYGILGLGAVIHGFLGVFSTGAVIIASKPTPEFISNPQASVNTVTLQFTLAPPIPTITSTLAPNTSEPTRTVTPSATIQPTEPALMTVHFIDVGQGDSILVKSPDGSIGLIDGGESDSGALQYLQSVEINHLNLVIATHPHSDHIGGLIDVLNTIPVDKVITNGALNTTLTYEQFLDAISNSKAEYVEVNRGDTISLGELNFSVLSPVDNTVVDLNDGSLVLKLVYGNISFLFTGDAQITAEENMLVSGLDVSATILKLAHHGSLAGSPLSFLTAVHPKVSIYSAGAGNDYGYPNPDTIEALKSLGSTIYGTDVNGTIIVTTDGNEYSITSTRKIPTQTPTTLPLTTQPPTELFINVVTLTSPISAGGMASLTVNTLPGAACTITVYLKSGPSQAAGLGPQTSGGDGSVTWTWKIGSRTTPGTWRIVVTTNLNDHSKSIEIPFEVR